MDKKLLRKIKHECIIDYSPKIEVDEEIYNQYLEDNYKEANKMPYDMWSLDDLLTRQEELLQLSYKISVLFPVYYREEYWFHSGEYYDLSDEIENRMYFKANENRYSIYDYY